MTKNIEITLRLPPELHARAKARAEGAFMSLNGYVLAAVAQVVAEDEYVPNPEDSARIWKAVETAIGSPEVMQRIKEGNALLSTLPHPKPTS